MLFALSLFLFTLFLPSPVSLRPPVTPPSPLKIISHDGTVATVLLSAATCRTNLGLTKVRCTEGMTRGRGDIIPFQELSYNGQHWKLRPTSGQTEQVDGLMDFRLR
jgi:hypothetical protein